MQASLSRALKLCAALLAALTIAATAADAATRRAFIVGNSAYQYTSVLANPVSDARGHVAGQPRDGRCLTGARARA